MSKRRKIILVILSVVILASTVYSGLEDPQIVELVDGNCVTTNIPVAIQPRGQFVEADFRVQK